MPPARRRWATGGSADLWRRAWLSGVREASLTMRMEFADFADF